MVRDAQKVLEGFLAVIDQGNKSEQEIARLREDMDALRKELTGRQPEVVPEWKKRYQKIYNTALIFYALRTDYVFGGTWGKNRTFDCSAFMQHIYGLWGVVLPRVSRNQAKEGTEVPFDQLREGDLVFFDTNGDGVINHVGMYIGNGEMIHTNNPTDRVNIKPINTGYWREKFVTARRVL